MDTLFYFKIQTRLDHIQAETPGVDWEINTEVFETSETTNVEPVRI